LVVRHRVIEYEQHVCLKRVPILQRAAVNIMRSFVWALSSSLFEHHMVISVGIIVVIVSIIITIIIIMIMIIIIIIIIIIMIIMIIITITS